MPLQAKTYGRNSTNTEENLQVLGAEITSETLEKPHQSCRFGLKASCKEVIATLLPLCTLRRRTETAWFYLGPAIHRGGSMTFIKSCCAVVPALLALFLSLPMRALALGYDGPGPERVAIVDQLHRIWVDDHAQLGQWRDVTGNLHAVLPAVVSRLAVSSDYLWASKPNGALFKCDRPCNGNWTLWHPSGINTVSGYGSALYGVYTNGWIWWSERAQAGKTWIAWNPRDIRFITGGSKQLHVLDWQDGVSRIMTYERQADGTFAAGNPSYVQLPAGRVVKISSAGDEFIALVNDQLWQFNHADRSFTYLAVRPHDYSVGARWLWRIGSTTQSPGSLTKTLLPCMPTACREINVPLPSGVVAHRVEAY